MDRDDYLLQSLPDDNEMHRCPECGSDDYFTDGRTGEYVCRDCFARADPVEFYYHGGRYDYIINLLNINY